MNTFLTDLMKKGYTQDEIFAVIFESDRERKRRRMQAIAIEAVAAHRLQQMRDLLAFEKVATWRKMNGFDQVADGEDNWLHGPRSLPPTTGKLAADLWCKVNALKDAISMPSQKVRNLINAIEQGEVSDEKFAILKRLVEKRGREAAQVTVTPVDTVQHCSSYSPNPDMPSSIYVELENSEAKMGPELDELKSSSAGTGFKTPGQQCPPNEGIWETGRTTASGILTVGAGPSQGENISSPTEREKSTTTIADISSKSATPSKRSHKPKSEENKQFDHGRRGEKARFGTRL